MEVTRALAVGRRLLREHGLDDWTIVADRAKTRAGVCRFARRQIGIRLRMLRLPLVDWSPPRFGSPYAGAAGACSMRTFDQSASNSSAMIMGIAVIMPWPISDWPTMMVTVSSVAMRTQELSAAGAREAVAALAGRREAGT